VHRYRLERFLLLDLRRGFQVGFAEDAFGLTRFIRGFGGKSLRREAGGNVFGAFDLVRVPSVVNLVVRPRLAGGFGAGFTGFAVRLLGGMAQPATGAKTHPTAASGKISVTHIQ
jgi:hypothetical protein